MVKQSLQNEFLQPLNSPVTQEKPQKISPYEFHQYYGRNVVTGSKIKPNTVDNSKTSYIYRGYNAIVYPVGTNIQPANKGDFIDIQTAIDYVNTQGGGKILIKNGIYNLISKLTLYKNIELIGESKESTIIDFGGTDSSIFIQGATTEYKTGTIGFTSGSAIIAGSGTAWLANANTTQKILIDGILYGIVSVNSDTSITLDQTYYGANFSSLSYVIANFINNVNLNNLTFQNSSGATVNGIIDFSYLSNSYLDNILVTKITGGATSGGIFLKRCYNIKINRAEVSLTYSSGIVLDSGQACVIDSCYIHNCITVGSGGGGIFFTNTLGLGTKNIIKDSFIGNNATAGILINIGKNIIKGNFIFRSGTDGIILNNNEIVISENIIEQNHNYGINLNSNANDNTITGNYLSFNTSGAILIGDINAKRNTIVGNTFRQSAVAYSLFFIAHQTQINYIQDNNGESFLSDWKFVLATNVSGGTITKGSLVVISGTAGMVPNVTTSTTVGTNLIYGMAAEDIINNAVGNIQIGGYTENLKVNGTTTIGNGDLLTQYSVAGIAAKAVVGNTIIAISYDSYAIADSNGVIRAFIIPPRLI